MKSSTRLRQRKDRTRRGSAPEPQTGAIVLHIENSQVTFYKAFESLELPLSIFESATIGQELWPGWQNSPEYKDRIQRLIFSLAGRGKLGTGLFIIPPIPLGKQRSRGKQTIQLIHLTERRAG
jgi:hypothetical protein